MPEQQDNFGRYALVLLVVSVLVRLLLISLPSPFFSSIPLIDGTYIQTGRDILHLNFHALGDRVPVYPLFVALCGLNPRAIWIAQSILGVLASLMIFDMAFRRTRHGLFSLLVGITCSLIPEILVYETSVYTEALATFLLVASFWLFAHYDGAGEKNIRYPLGLGAIVALEGLNRPLMICLVPVYYCFLVPLWPPAKILRSAAIKRTFYFALPVAVGILGWCGFNYFNNGYFTPTLRTGQQLMDQVDPYVGLAPDRFAVLRDIWLQLRQPNRPSPDFVSVDIEEALPEMERQTGKTDIQVNHELVSLALYLEIHHPLLCLRRAQQGWNLFWGEPSNDEIEWPQRARVRLTEFLTSLANFLVREVKAAFLVLALLSLPCALLRPKTFIRIEYLAFAIVLWASIFEAFAEFGDNRRYCVPFYMLIFYTVLTRGWIWIAATPPEGRGAVSD